MLNLRKIDKFWLSGGWQDLPRDIEYLKELKFKAVLDCQFNPYDEVNTNSIKDALGKEGIEYLAIPMYDGHGNDLEQIFEKGADFLTDVDARFTAKKDKILVKCAVGTSRSASQLINYFCQSRRLTFIESLQYILDQENKDYNTMYGVMPSQEFIYHLMNKYPDYLESTFGDVER